MSYFDRLKAKWGIESNFQLILVLVVFALTGSASVWVAKPILNMLGVSPDLNPWLRIPLRILIVFPVYQVMLLLIGASFGQFRFFYRLQRKWFRLDK